MFDLRQGGAAGFGDGVSDFADAGLMRRALEYASATGLPVFEFPNNPSLSAGGVMHEGAVSTRLGLKGVPRAAEEARVYRAIALVRLTGAAVHLGPISAAASVEAIRRAKVEGLPVTCAVTAAHLRFIDEDIEAGWSTCLKVMPVLRAKEDREALIEGLRDGTIDAIATGHGAMGLVDKQVPFPKAEFGMLGLQTALGIALELSQAGGLSMARILGALSVGPARCLRQALPIIQKGRPADLVMFDPSEETVFTAEEIQSKAVNTPYLGQSLPGRIHGTWVDGLRVFPTQAPKSTEERK